MAMLAVVVYGLKEVLLSLWCVVCSDRRRGRMLCVWVGLCVCGCLWYAWGEGLSNKKIVHIVFIFYLFIGMNIQLIKLMYKNNDISGKKFACGSSFYNMHGHEGAGSVISMTNLK